ncbi:hypothetical protein BCV69DRAFT_31392 [Microstroma glucosiphilum]|uniref:Yeast cell wall synthesis Kre9/Knh1-like N-terminal domain-containing protein n=1 Tax=Pseudomicrostroma glucosiphilum TaxID=1684307 RepID=A0A316U3B1_9BASI|nr:hypothetical protein BCV69DRAFT_31392 [Pseudomicrostroma glucosiphilum]PWN19737.1 hypothetical protein BCV69DRAFT_31392 [Pseudomicrostroma glucosiphilum]
MQFSIIASALLALASSPALATLYFTNPISSSNEDGGSTFRIKWEDKGSPALSSWGGINLYLATGDTSTQYKLDTIASDLSTSRTSYKYKVPANVGPSGTYYFIRAESTKTAANGTANDLAFSAKFKLEQMTGTFNSTVLSAAKAAATVDASSASTAASSAAGSATSSSSKMSTVASGSSTSASTATTSGTAAQNNAANSTSGAEGLFAPQRVVMGALGAVAAGVAVLL